MRRGCHLMRFGSRCFAITTGRRQPIPPPARRTWWIGPETSGFSPTNRLRIAGPRNGCLAFWHLPCREAWFLEPLRGEKTSPASNLGLDVRGKIADRSDDEAKLVRGHAERSRPITDGGGLRRVDPAVDRSQGIDVDGGHRDSLPAWHSSGTSLRLDDIGCEGVTPVTILRVVSVRVSRKCTYRYCRLTDSRQF